MATLLYINGTNVGRYGIVLNQLSLSMDGPDVLTWTQLATTLPGEFRQGQSAILVVDGSLVFNGPIVSLHPSGMGQGPINVGYRAMGLNWLCNQVWVTGTDGSGKIAFNLQTTDPAYVASMSGLTVGQILAYLYTLHATQLTAVGITGYNSTDLNALTIVPPDPVICTGRLWNNVVQLMTTYYNSYGSWIVPGGTYSSPTGTIRHENLLGLPTTTFTLDVLDGSSNACILESISEDFSECYTQCVIRGYDNCQGAYLSLHDGTLTWAQTTAQQNAWNYQTFINPPGGWETGTISGMTSTTLSVTATSPIPITYTATTWWSMLDAEVWAYNPIATSVAFSEQRRITANTVPSGNTYTMTVDTAFANAGYTNYQIRGLGSFQCITTAGQVWRKLWITPTYVAQHLVQQFSHSVPWTMGTDGVLVQTTTPMANVIFTSGGQTIAWPMTFQLIPFGTAGPFTTTATATLTLTSNAVSGYSGLAGGSGYPASNTIACAVVGGGGSGANVTATSNSSGVITALTIVAGGSGYTSAPTIEIGTSNGYILFDQPVCSSYCSQTTLNSGGASIPAPTDIKVLVPYSTGAITAVAPSSGYQGTAYTVNGVQRTLYLDYPEWLDYASQSNYNALAQQKLNCVMNTVIEGSLVYFGKQSTFFALGQAVNITGATYTTGYEAINAPARSVVLDFKPDGGAVSWVTQIGFSTRMKPYSGDRLYAHPSYGSQRALASGGFGYGAGIAAAGVTAGIDWSGGMGWLGQDRGGGDIAGTGVYQDPRLGDLRKAESAQAAQMAGPGNAALLAAQNAAAGNVAPEERTIAAENRRIRQEIAEGDRQDRHEQAMRQIPRSVDNTIGQETQARKDDALDQHLAGID
jgi:hypothetical protein